MREPQVVELRHLRPGIRRAMIEGRQTYRDQVRLPSLGDQQLKVLQTAGISPFADGTRHLLADALTPDSLRHHPDRAVRDVRVRVDSLDQG